MVVRVDIVGPDELREVLEPRRETDRKGGVLPSHRIVASRSDDRLVGACRLAREHGVTVLRGMREQPALRRQGIGSRPFYEPRRAGGR